MTDQMRLNGEFVPEAADAPFASLNEVFCQTLAQACGLPAAIPQQVIAEGGQRGCLYPASLPLQPYDGPPELSACFRWLEDKVDDVRAEQQVLMDYLLFSILIGYSNADGHLLALIHEAGGPRLAPLRGVSCTAVFPHLPQRLALQIGHATSISALRAADWKELLSHTQLERGDLLTRGLDLAQRIRQESRTLATSYEGLPGHYVVPIILSTIEQNSTGLLQAVKGFFAAA